MRGARGGLLQPRQGADGDSEERPAPPQLDPSLGLVPLHHARDELRAAEVARGAPADTARQQKGIAAGETARGSGRGVDGVCWPCMQGG